MLFTDKAMKKNYNKNKWYPGQRVMFLDDRRHTSDELLKGMPRRGEICTVRRVLGITSQDTGERGIGLYLVGYHNPCEDGSWEYCYEAERFLPLRLIEALLAKETSWTADVPPLKYNARMKTFLGLCEQYFSENNILHQIGSSGTQIGATLPGRFGAFPFSLKFLDPTEFHSHCFVPIRIQPEQLELISELVHRMSNQTRKGRYELDYECNLVNGRVSGSINAPKNDDIAQTLAKNGESYPEHIIRNSLFLADRIFCPMMKVLSRGASPEEAVQRQLEIEAKVLGKRSTQKNRLLGLRGGSPDLN